MLLAALAVALVVTGCGKDRPTTDAAKPAPPVHLRSISEPRGRQELCDVPAARRGYEVEPEAAADQARPNQVVAAWQADRLEVIGAAGIALASSEDGGRTWPRRMAVAAACGRSLADPSLAVSGDTTYLAYVDFPRNKHGVARVVVATLDTTKTRGLHKVVVDELDTLDKPAIAIDPEDAETLYLAWIQRRGGEDGPNAVMFSSTRDGGRTWRRPLALDDQIPVEAQGTEVVAFNSGGLLVVYSGVPGLHQPARIVTIHGVEHGERWYDAQFSGTASDYEAAVGSQTLRTGDFFPAVAANSGGRIVIASQRNESGRGSIVATTSADFGETWSPMTPIVAADAQLFTPTVSIAGDGRVGVVYYALRRGTVEPWLAQTSRTPSGTWTRATKQRLGSAASLSVVPQRNGFLGDYQGLVSTPAAFVPVLTVPAGGSDGPTRVVAGTVAR